MHGMGPLQLVVIEFQSAVLPPLVHAQIDAWRRRGLTRLVDSVVTVKGDEGNLIMLETLDAPRGDPVLCGVLARSLFGSNVPSSCEVSTLPDGDLLDSRSTELGITEEQLLEVADLIPTNAHALILLIEHLWAMELDMAATEAEGHVVANCWISPSLLGQMLRREEPLFK